MAEIAVYVREAGDGWVAHVRVSDGSETRHDVTVSRAMLERLAHGRSAEELVRASFEFLLEREPKESILRKFEIGVIARYFPEYEREIVRRMHA